MRYHARSVLPITQPPIENGTVVESEPPRLFTLKALAGPVRFTVRHELEPAEGGTRLTVVAEGDVPGFANGIVARFQRRQRRRDG